MFWRVFLIVLLTLINVMLFQRTVWGPTGLLEYKELKRQYAGIERQIANLEKQNLSLSREIRLLQSDDRYIARMIRQRLHYVRDNEILYIFDESADARRRE
ncbi:MAG: septum formation initiator family protein [Desulfovibrio sp.]|jgi:cell division protein FtsB|nr:septum formation initiator family protein [Desulfovibrio sp.]